jgi:hypothetical protein
MNGKSFCKICRRELDRPEDPTTRNCGGDCLKCMAECGDKDCERELLQLTGQIGALNALGQGSGFGEGGGAAETPEQFFYEVLLEPRRLSPQPGGLSFDRFKAGMETFAELWGVDIEEL